MNAQKLFELISFFEDLDKSLGVQANLEQVKEALTNLTNSPANPPFQATLASTLQNFESVASKLRSRISPAQMSAITEMGGEDFFDPNIGEKVRDVIQRSAMTPSVARDFVQNLANKRATFLGILSSTRTSLRQLNVGAPQKKLDSSDISFLIPRSIFQNRLEVFAKELTFISRLIQHLNEALTGETHLVQLEELGSSEPTVTVAASLVVTAALAKIVNSFLDAWIKIEKIRKMRSDLNEMGMGDTTDKLTEKITETVEDVVEESTQTLIMQYTRDGNRKNELENAIRQDTKRLFGQIERGLTIEFGISVKNDSENQEAFDTVADLNKKLHFPIFVAEPLLLENGNVVEGEIRTVQHSTKTRKTATTKKEVKEAKEAKENKDKS
jgi:predicted transcriptional regulator